jgi:hypothetical protein
VCSDTFFLFVALIFSGEVMKNAVNAVTAVYFVLFFNPFVMPLIFYGEAVKNALNAVTAIF